MKISHKLAVPAVVIALSGTGYALISSLAAQNTAVQAKSNNTLLNKKINESISKINIETSDNIRVKLGNEYKVTYDGPKKSAPDIKYHNGELELSSPQSFSNIFFFIKHTYNLTITIPKTKLQSFNVNSSNGDVIIDYLNVDKGSISASNGDVMITHLEANRGGITDSNGDISMGNLITQNGFYLSATNGNIKVEKGNATDFDFSNSNGSNTLNGTDVSDNYEQNLSKQNVLTVENSNGDIDIF